MAASIFLVGMLLWGMWRGSRSPLLALASLFFGSLVAYMLYPLTAATLADNAGLPMLPSCVIAAAGLFVIVTLLVRVLLGQLVRKANVKQKELEEAPAGDETWWTQTTLIFADDPQDKPPGAFTRICGGAFALLTGCWLLMAAGLVNAWMNPPFPRLQATAGQSRIGNIFETQVQPRLVAAPHLALAQRIAQLARAAGEINRAGPLAVKAAAERPEIRAVFADPAIVAALDDPELPSLIESGNLSAVLRHPRLAELLRRSDARAALLNAPIGPALDAAEEIVIGKREVAKVDPPKVDPPKVDPPKVDPPKVDPPKADPPPKPDLIPSIPTPRPKTYAHGHKKHACDAGCQRFVPPHGDDLHACDSACLEFVAPHGHRLHRCGSVCPQYKAPHGHRLHDCSESCSKFVPPHGHRMHACDSTCPEFKAVHGHRQHRCGPGCSKYRAPHGHRLHDCDESCSKFVPPHGHRLHACDHACSKFEAPHGHRLHRCAEGCASFVPAHGHARHSCGASCPEFKAPHGHRLHRCAPGCSKYNAPHGHRLHDCGEACPQFVPPHGHRLHACDHACSEFKAPHGHRLHRCAEGCSKFVPPHGHRLHRCAEGCSKFVPPHGHRLHRCAKGCASYKAPIVKPKVEPKPRVEPKPEVEPKPKVEPKPAKPLLPPTPARIHRVYAASNPYSLVALKTLRPGQSFAFRAEIEIQVATRRDVKKVVRWRVLDSAGKVVKAFERADRSPAAVGKRTSYVAGHVPPDLAPGGYTLEVAASLPDHLPVTKSTGLTVEAAPLLVRRVSLGATTEPSSRISSASAGVTVYLRAVYAVQGRAATLRRRLSWRVTNSAGRSIPELEGSRNERHGGEFEFVHPFKLPADLPVGTYWFQFSVEAGGEITEGQATLSVRR